MIVPWFGYQFCIPHLKFRFVGHLGHGFSGNSTKLASPDLATLRDQRLFFGQGHKNTAGESGKTSMDSEVRSCWERFQDIYPPVI